jgi:hypothetical protein
MELTTHPQLVPRPRKYICLHGVVLNELRTGTTFTSFSKEAIAGCQVPVNMKIVVFWDLTQCSLMGK